MTSFAHLPISIPYCAFLNSRSFLGKSWLMDSLCLLTGSKTKMSEFCQQGYYRGFLVWNCLSFRLSFAKICVNLINVTFRCWTKFSADLNSFYLVIMILRSRWGFDHSQFHRLIDDLFGHPSTPSKQQWAHQESACSCPWGIWRIARLNFN